MANSSHICPRCVMGGEIPGIRFDEQGTCNFCNEFDAWIAKRGLIHMDETEALDDMRKRIVRRSSGKPYDCVIGLSGGVDSSYIAYLAWKLKLKCLAVHFDNGWNTEVSVRNIKNIIETTGFDLHTYVIDWPEFRSLQRAFIKAGVIDIELVTDHAIFAAMYKLARDRKIKTILSGTNFATEHGMPRDWSWYKQDLRNIVAINQRFGDRKLKKFPMISSLKWQLMLRCHIGPSFEEPLDLVQYKKSRAIEVLKREFDWREYGGKHYESNFTKFYQGYILPRKFGCDKRLVHLSALIRNAELSRTEALALLKKDTIEKTELEELLNFVTKKLGFDKAEFERILAAEPVRHDVYPSSRNTVYRLVRLGHQGKQFLRKIGVIKPVASLGG
jgi:N-acetyl sugar amidotransferase